MFHLYKAWSIKRPRDMDQRLFPTQRNRTESNPTTDKSLILREQDGIYIFVESPLNSLRVPTC